MFYVIHSPTLGYLALPYTQRPVWMAFDAHAWTTHAESAEEALNSAKRLADGHVAWPDDAVAEACFVTDVTVDGQFECPRVRPTPQTRERIERGMRTFFGAAVALALTATTLQAQGKNTGPRTPEPDGLLVVHVTQNRDTGAWTERAVMRVCAIGGASPAAKHGPKGEAIEYYVQAGSKPCPRDVPAGKGTK